MRLQFRWQTSLQCDSLCLYVSSYDSLYYSWGDTIVINITWGDGSSLQDTFQVQGGGFYRVYCHSYGTPGAWSVNASAYHNSNLLNPTYADTVQTVQCVPLWTQASYPGCYQVCVTANIDAPTYSGNQVLTVVWDWGDGQTDSVVPTVQVASAYDSTCHDYTNAGYYPVAIYIVVNGDVIDTLF